ncbi:MAG: PaaI family thioesterase, partial [Burkholderiaceae bacterium]|nr:PaaI family thioesterase [Burkholderiaceae bacterium]MCU0929352.1 PaaI family thioesterase [Burkholderiaceae bacterium]
GVVMTLLDVAMAVAARSVQRHGAEPGHGVATVEMKTSFMQPAEGELRAHGRLIHRTATLAFCEGWLADDHGHRCAHASGTFKYLRALPTRGRVLKVPDIL